MNLGETLEKNVKDVNSTTKPSENDAKNENQPSDNPSGGLTFIEVLSLLWLFVATLGLFVAKFLPLRGKTLIFLNTIIKYSSMLLIIYGLLYAVTTVLEQARNKEISFRPVIITLACGIIPLALTLIWS